MRSRLAYHDVCFFDYDRIEIIDEKHNEFENRYDSIGDASVANLYKDNTIIGTPTVGGDINDILFVVYTDRIRREKRWSKGRCR